MIKISNDEPVILETSDYRFEFANLEQALRPRSDAHMICIAQRIYDKKNGVYIKERFVGAEVANAILNFAIGVNP
jgi:hypothetical protein